VTRAPAVKRVGFWADLINGLAWRRVYRRPPADEPLTETDSDARSEVARDGRQKIDEGIRSAQIAVELASQVLDEMASGVEQITNRAVRSATEARMVSARRAEAHARESIDEMWQAFESAERAAEMRTEGRKPPLLPPGIS
jgi:hypothetical protein